MKVKCQVLTVASVEMTAPCSLVEVYRRFRGAYCVHWVMTPIMETVSTSETFVNFCQASRRNIPEDIHLIIILCD
jgi:hypothetical protein